MSDTVCPNDSTELQVMPEDPMLGKVVAKRYKIVSRLGRGGMSVVYKAHHQFMDRLVAIKMLRSELASDEDSLKRLQIESKAISALKHPNIVPVYDFGMLENDIPFLVMEYLEGEDLDRYIKTSAPISYIEAIPKFISICDGLEHAHQNGIIHRDIKPSNIILVTENDGERVPVIVDFGIAKMVDLNGEDLNKLTATGQVFGSPLYMSPEQCSARRPDARSDIYSVGCVMYLALTGQSPLKGNTPVDTMVKHIQASPKPFSEVLGVNDIPTKVELCVFKALEKDPDHRFSSMQEFSDALKNCMNSLSYNSLGARISKPQSSSSEQFIQSLSGNVKHIGESTGSNKSEDASPAQEVSCSSPAIDQPSDQGSNSNSSELFDGALQETGVPQKKELKIVLVALVVVGILTVCGVIYMTLQNKDSVSEQSVEVGPKLQTVGSEPVNRQSAENKNKIGSGLPSKEFEKVAIAKFKLQGFIEQAGWKVVEEKDSALVDPRDQNIGKGINGVIHLISFDYGNLNYEQVARKAFLDLKKRLDKKIDSKIFDDIMVGGDPVNRIKKQQVEYELKGGKSIHSFIIYHKNRDKLKAVQLVPKVDFRMSISEQELENRKNDEFTDQIIKFCFVFEGFDEK